MITLKKRLVGLFIITLMLCISSLGLSSSLAKLDIGDDNAVEILEICRNSKINNDVIEFVEILNNRGTIVGDLFVVGKEVWNHGIVIGDILGANIVTYISGVTKGNVRIITKKLEITGEVYRNVSVITKDLILEEPGVIDGSVTVIGDKVEINGMVSSDIRGQINTLIITGDIKGDVDVSVSKIQFGQNGKIHGNLNYISSNEILIPDFKVNGKITYRKGMSFIEEHHIPEKITLLQALKYLFDFFVMLFKCI